MKNGYTFLLILFPLFVLSQNKISGIVSNNINQNLANVLISIPEIHRETTSDNSGFYSLSNLPKGNFKIEFSIMGYAIKSFPVTIPEKEITLNVSLDENTIHMDEVIISTAFNKLQSQNVMKVAHENLKSLQEKGSATLIEGLATVPGVAQISTGTSVGKPVIRGLSGNRVLVYSQGVRLENQQFGEEHGLGLNDAGVESVEVIKGPASLLYGSDALGGVLYFNPEKFANTNEFKTDFGQRLFSNTLGSNTSIGVKTSTTKWKFLTRGSYSTHADYQIPNNNRVTNTRYNETDFKSGIGYNNSSFSSVLRYNFNKLNLGIPEEGIAEQSTSRDILYPKQVVDSHILSLHNNFYFKNSKIDADLGYVFNDRSEFEDSNNPSLRMKLRTLNFDVKYHLPKFRKFETIIGFQGMHQTNSNFGEEILIPNAITNDFGVFGTIYYEWNKNVLQAGLRYDNRKIQSETHGSLSEEGYFEAIDKNFNSFNSSLGYKTTLSENLIFRANIASGFRAPNLAELTSNGVHEGSNRYEIGNPNLKNEQNLQTDLNLEYKTTHFEFFTNGFYNHINNYIYIAQNGMQIDNNDVFDYVQSNAVLYGGEAGIHFHPHPIDWLHFTSSFETVIGIKENKDYLPLIPAKKWNNSFRANFKIKDFCKEGFATLTIENTFSQNNFSEFESKTNGYTLVNMGLGGKITLNKMHFDVNLNANNLLNKTYTSHLSRLKTDGIPNIGRNIIFGINFII